MIGGNGASQRRFGEEAGEAIEIAAVRAAGSDGAFAGDHPLGFGDLLVFDLEPQCCDVGRLAFFDQSEVGSLAAHGIEVRALHLAE